MSSQAQRLWILDADKPDDNPVRTTESAFSVGTTRRVQTSLIELTQAEDERRDLNYELFDLSIINEQHLRKIKSCYERLISLMRTIILHSHSMENRHLLRVKMMVYCEEFTRIVDERVMPHYWVSVDQKGIMLRLKADFLRYLYEVAPKNVDLQRKAHSAYNATKTFFTAHRLLKSPELLRVRLNYAALLYLDGYPTAALFICKQLLRSVNSKQLDPNMERRIRRNVEFFKRACLN